ncbi:MAG TPA: hypothetical protein QGF95_06555 [Candidatus Latescibacteria bacterium]|nr:hypothetical protein [Candidatus Latescibacterota bacterium]HJP30197.1 hypothetical protein [Candidatus Latescibacterota bacterium]
MVLLVPRSPAEAIDSLVVGLDSGTLFGWRNVADWGDVERVTVTYDSLFKWDVSPGDNLAPGLLRRGGRLVALYEIVEEDSLIEVMSPLPDLENLVDGDGATAFDPDRSGETGVPRDLYILIDLGASFSINRIRLHPRLDEEHRIRFPQQFRVLTSDNESIEDPFTVVSQLNFGSILPNSEPVIDRVFASREARFVEIHTTGVQPWELAEIEIYGDGTVPVGQFQSVPLPARHAFPVWGRVRFEGGDVTGLPMVMQTRTGPDRTPILYFRYTGVGDDVEQIPAGVWGALPEEEQGPVEPNPEWSAWTTVSGGFIRSTGLHRYIQIRLRFSEPGTIIRRLILEYAQPALVERLQAEVHPRLVTPGEEDEFTLSVLSHTITTNREVVSGFRQLEVLTTASVAAIDRVLIDDVEVPFAARIRAGEGFTVNLGQRITQDGTFLQIVFRASLFRDATRFETRVSERRVSSGRLESVYQTAEAGDIDIDSPGGELVVRLVTNEDLEIVGRVLTSSPILTPNGDAINDVTTIGFSLFKLTRPTMATVEIFDLGGRQLRQLLREELGDGHHEILWDGTDAFGRVVGPGGYIYRVSLDGDDGIVTRQGLLGVIY